ncbi:uncharacterized protein LOC103506363 [Diaphorina citri]|uniref:Uncharacterized protein LOC103506363 n=1 Tax=Diaphorina citri TaxID=121845 RepID=A0A1S3CW36_DIACI|nr:uncharacterized protein LOC103506363 [Diaphorina citri]
MSRHGRQEVNLDPSDQVKVTLLIEPVRQQIKITGEQNKRREKREKLEQQLKSIQAKCNTIVAQNQTFTDEKRMILERVKQLKRRSQEKSHTIEKLEAEMRETLVDRMKLEETNVSLVNKYHQLETRLQNSVENIKSLQHELSNKDTVLESAEMLPSIPDERYWIVTVLKTHAAQFYLTPAEIEPRLVGTQCHAEMPEPLSHMLEHEDVPSSVLPSQPPLTRHKSVEGDPGVIGPIVWDLHCHRVQKQSKSDLAPSPTGDEDEILSEPNMSVGGMRKRFHELLDDAFSLFSSKSSSIDSERNSPPQTSPTTGENRSKSAVIRPVCVEVVTPDSHLRPRTSTDLIPVRPSTSNGMASPRGAWDTNPSTPGSRPHARPLSAGPFHRPTLEPAIVLADGVLSPSDPAVPLIEAIKRELDRFPPVASASERRPLQHPDHSYA